jgi:hypothetical protein
MLTIEEDALWTIGAKARQAAQSKAEWITSSAEVAAELAVAAVADVAIEKLSAEVPNTGAPCRLAGDRANCRPGG